MPMHDEMNDRSRRRRAESPTQTVVHRKYQRAHDDATRAAALGDPTEVLEAEPPASAAPASTAPDAAPVSYRREGTVLAGRYELEKILGRGASGVVYRGRDQLLGREVAIKLLHADLTGNREASARFQQEARLAARVQHPNAVAVFDVGVHDGQPFIVMECVAGETLSNRIAASPLTIDEVRAIGAQLLGALEAAHKQGVIHRDVKPSNLLMTPSGSVKVADFGIATAADRTALTSIGSVVGTLAYLAPERLEGALATERSDLYSVGVVLYEALTGTKPFAGDTPAALLSSITTDPAIPITEHRPDVPDAVAATIMRAIERDPAARYATAAEMAQALAGASVLADRRSSLPAPPLPPPPAPLSYVAAGGARQSSGRRRLAFAAIGIAVLAAGTLAAAERGVFSNQLPPSNTSPDNGTLDVARVEEPTTSVTTSTVPTTTQATSSTRASSTTRVTTTTRPTTTRPTTTAASGGRGKGNKKNDD
jgi:serine/threonine-protein kinase